MIGWMASDFFKQSPVLALPVLALFLFMLVFISINIRTWCARKSEIERIAHLPLETEGKHDV